MLVVGEASGDLHGARLVGSLHRQIRNLEVFGVGGERLKNEKFRVIFDVARLTAMGLSELKGNIANLWEAYRLLRKALKKERPDLLVLVDFPEFNLRLARAAKRLQIPVLYYISPQIWAWRRGRVRKIARCVDRMAVAFPFEVPIYEQAGVQVAFVGHPLLDVVRPTEDRETTLERYGLDPNRKTIAILPGSRKLEVFYHVATMLDAVRRLREETDAQFILVRASTVSREEIMEQTAKAAPAVTIADGDTYNVLNACDLAWVASGTATLEAALLKKPMIIVYRVARLTYALARLLVRVKHIGMVNIMAGEYVVPELIQSEFTGKRMVDESKRFLLDPALRVRTGEKLGEVREKLGSPGAADRVAAIAVSMLGVEPGIM
jgi:lipid-A-disaccharide synthase